MFSHLFRLIFPDICLGCNTLLVQNETLICSSCRYELPETKHWKIATNEMMKTITKTNTIQFGAALLYFHKNGITQQLIHHLKYKRKEEIGAFLATLYLDEIDSIIKKYGITEIVPVPIHQKKEQIRGYNQVDLFATTIAKETGITYCKNRLIRTKNTKSQTTKNRTARLKSLTNIFLLNSEIKPITASHFLLIDDVFTTGATIEQCTKELLKTPKAKVSVLTMAYTV